MLRQQVCFWQENWDFKGSEACFGARLLHAMLYPAVYA
jgi:hypothetical protein